MCGYPSGLMRDKRIIQRLEIDLFPRESLHRVISGRITRHKGVRICDFFWVAMHFFHLCRADRGGSSTCIC